MLFAAARDPDSGAGKPRGPLLYSRRARPDQDHSGAMPNVTSKPLTVAVVGATGVVGGTMIRMLLEREFPFGELRLLASARSAGSKIDVAGTKHEVREATPEAFEGVDIALFSAGGDTSKALAPQAARRGTTVIDNSSAWRMDPAVPLVVSQVNADDLAWHEGIIANPNCSTMQLVPVLMALRDAVGLGRQGDQGAAGPGRGVRRRAPARGRGLPPPDRLQRSPAGRCLPRQRLHQGGVETRHREPQDPAPA
jgi:aspartate-semialdehyde dehydrogenase